MKLIGTIMFALAMTTAGAVTHRQNRISLRNKFRNNHRNTIAGKPNGTTALRRKARDMKIGGVAIESEWIEFYVDPFYPYFEQYASAQLGFPATVVDKEFQDLVLDMTDDDYYLFFMALGTHVIDWVNGNTELIATMSDAEFDAMSNNIKF